MTHWILCHRLNVCWVIMFLLEGQNVYWQMFVCVYECCLGVCGCVCVFGGRGGCCSGLLPVCVLSTLPSAKSLPMPLWFYLLYYFLVNFYFLCAILISLTMPIKGNVFEKKKSRLSFGGFSVICLSLKWWMSLHQALLYHFHSVPRNDDDLCSLITIKETSLKFFKWEI